MQLSTTTLGTPLAIANFAATTPGHCLACLGVASGLVAVGTSGDACPGAVQMWAGSPNGWRLSATITEHNAALVGCDFGRVVHVAKSSVLAVGIPDADGGVGLVEVYNVTDPEAPEHVLYVLWHGCGSSTLLPTAYDLSFYMTRRQPRSARCGLRWECTASANRSQAVLRGERRASIAVGDGF